MNVKLPDIGMNQRDTQTDFVDFSIIGVQKSGTRALGHFLSQHPEIGLPSPSIIEPHFFDTPEAMRSSSIIKKYHSLYTVKSLKKVTGDITPNYIYWKTALPALRRYNKNLKIIVLLRNPTARAYSQWVMQIESGKEQSNFFSALLKEPFRKLRYGQHRNFSYIQRGFYDRQIKRLFKYFPREQCLILRSSDLRHNHSQTMHMILSFLEVDPEIIPPAETIHSRKYGKIPKISEYFLRFLYYGDISRLEKRMGWDCSDWKKF